MHNLIIAVEILLRKKLAATIFFTHVILKQEHYMSPNNKKYTNYLK